MSKKSKSTKLQFDWKVQFDNRILNIDVSGIFEGALTLNSENNSFKIGLFFLNDSKVITVRSVSIFVSSRDFS